MEADVPGEAKPRCPALALQRLQQLLLRPTVLQLHSIANVAEEAELAGGGHHMGWSSTAVALGLRAGSLDSSAPTTCFTSGRWSMGLRQGGARKILGSRKTCASPKGCCPPEEQ
eukprot:CAMPEP_0196570994 /NCGR_PEP_ID=MMETSP1081-20130531/1175_1 /TAXON_ID=36882 /ORGANISM="Pyramimonas amylifera, Strain CCMP720" /LENGTH=113 /DNA_ID=CAMNT_0041887735 /DNA_START=696 /DNA_END=1038 /DNA_ORIENTATION=+